MGTLSRWRERRRRMHTASVLLADDDVRFRSIVRSLLESDGYRVVGRGRQRRRDARGSRSAPARRRGGRPRDGGLRRPQHRAGAAGARPAAPGDRDLEPLRSAPRDRGRSGSGRGTWRRSRASKPSSTPSTRRVLRSATAAERLPPSGGGHRATLRAEYERTGLDVGDVDPDPFVQVRAVDGRSGRRSRPTSRRGDPRHRRRRRAPVGAHGAAARLRPARRARSSRATTAARARTSPPTRTAPCCSAGCRCSARCTCADRSSGCRATESEAYFATRPRGQPAGGVGVAPVERARRPRRARGPLRRRRRPGSRARTSRARRTGAATAWCPTRSSCGRAGPTGCTTASATSATRGRRPAGGSSASARERSDRRLVTSRGRRRRGRR